MVRPTLTLTCALLLALACAAAAGGASPYCTRRRLVDDASVAERESAQHLRSWRRLTWRWLTGGDGGDERLGGGGGDERIGDERRRLGSASDDPCGDHSGHHIPFTFNDVEQFALFYIALWACGKLAEALWLPSLAGELLCGMVLGPRLSSFVPKPDAVMMIGQVGLVLEMVSCGLEVDLDMLVAYGPRALCAALLGSALPFAIAFGLATAVGLSAEAAYVVAIAAMPTAVGVATKVMNMGHVLNTPLGQLVLLATVVDDIIAFINLGELKVLADPDLGGVSYLWPVLSSVLLLAGVGWLAVDVVPRLVESKLLPRVQQRHHDVVLTSLLCAMAVGLMAVCHRTKTFPLLGAFLAGLSFCSIAPVHHVWAHQVKRIQYSLLRLFYGATIAFEVPVATMWTGRIIGRGALFFLAIAGKFATGFTVGHYSAHHRSHDLQNFLRAGFAMAVWGEISLLAGFQGLVDNVIDEDTFGSIVFAVLLSVFVGPWALRWRLWHDRKADRARNWAIEKELAVEDEEGGGDTRYPHFVYYTLDISCAAKFGLLSKLVNVAVDHDLEVIDFRVHGAHVKGGHDVVYEFYLKDALLLAHIDDAYRERAGTAMSTPTPTTLDVLDTARERAHSFLGLGHNGRPASFPEPSPNGRLVGPAAGKAGRSSRSASFLGHADRPASFLGHGDLLKSEEGREAALMLDRVHSRVSRARAHAAIGHPSPSATQLALTSVNLGPAHSGEEEGEEEGGEEGGKEGEEARVSALLREHGDLPSLVLPAGTADGWRDVSATMPPTAARERAWRRELWLEERRGAARPPWRRAAPDAAGGGRPEVGISRPEVGISRPEVGISRPEVRPSLLLLLPADSGPEGLAELARLYAPLYRAAAAPSSRYVPRLALLPRRGGGSSLVGRACEVWAAPLAGPRGAVELCRDAGRMLELPSADFGSASDDGAGRCAALLVALDDVVGATQPAALVVPSGDTALAEAAREVAAEHGVALLQPPAAELPLLEWVATLPPEGLRRWHEPRVTLCVITERRPASLERLLASVSAAHFLGDTVDLSISADADADAGTLALSRGWAWPHGATRLAVRAAKGGLVAAVAEAWTPDGYHSHGLLLEDDIEVSPYFYVYAKLALLRYAVSGEEGGGVPASGHAAGGLLGVSLYTPRLVELTMPRRRVDMQADLGTLPASAGGGVPHLYLQQLPCSWGSLFLPRPWLLFRAYMQARLEGAPGPLVPRSASNGWSTSWKKFMIELSHLSGGVFLYPSFPNQSSLSTNHLEKGEHIGGKKNKLTHRPIDFTVPLLLNLSDLRQLWPPQPLDALPVRDLFTRPTRRSELHARGIEAIAAHRGVWRSHAREAAAPALRLDRILERLLPATTAPR